jgi:glucose/arabinose dehydrogenase
MRRLWAACLALGACSDPAMPRPDPLLDLVAVEVAAGLDQPVQLSAPPADARLFIVEQPGRIRVIRDGNLLARPFLDLTAIVGSGGERGLLGMAFDPAYAQTGHFWVNYTGLDGATRIERYAVSADPDLADPASARLVLRVDQPYSNHNGGLIAFGPDDMLYIGMGDGGSGGDPLGHGQNLGTLLGAMLRLDVRSADPYGIPADNPFLGTAGARPEIWAYGLRNPWRFAFDAQSGLLFIADVGQSTREEINAVPASTGGLNYGWNIMEGATCHSATSCNAAGLTLPIHEYGRADGCAVTGGVVYRGTRLVGLQGTYFYSDYCRGWLRSFRVVSGAATQHRSWDPGPLGNVVSFGEDAAGEVYVIDIGGSVFRLEPR